MSIGNSMHKERSPIFNNSYWQSKITSYEKLVAISFAISIPHAKALSFGVLLTLPLLLTSSRSRVKWANKFLFLLILSAANGIALTIIYNSNSYDHVEFLNIGAHLVNYSMFLVALVRFPSFETLLEFVVWHYIGLILFPNPYVGQGFAAYWKYVFGTPVTVFALYLVRKRLRLTYLVAALLADFSIANGFRSLSLILLGSMLIFWFSTKGSKVTQQKKVIGTVIATLSLVSLSIILINYIDRARQLTGDSFHVGSFALGRVEFFSGIQFMSHHIFGFGLGALPPPDVIYSAEQYLVNGGFRSDNSYMLNFLLNGSIKFHSFTLDAWSTFGIFGLILGVTSLYYGVRAILLIFQFRFFGPVIAFLVLQGLWDLLFSPFNSNGQSVICMVAIGIFLKKETSPTIRKTTLTLKS